MSTLKTSKDIDNQLSYMRVGSEKTIGFVPTMGALHEGHLSLVRRAKQECDVVVVSIFVNPTQFNNPEDLRLYPRQPEKDIALLEEVGADFIFVPTVEEIYPPNYKEKKVDLGFIGRTMEGEHRPGHFDGVVNVVSRLFELIQPNKAYFGLKDFQQVAVIKEMVKQLHFNVEIISVEIKRNDSGLALSSRNMRLNEQAKKDALIIYKTLKKGKEWAKTYSPAETAEKMINYFGNGVLGLEYLKIVHPDTLKELNGTWAPRATACIVAFCDGVRLLDNMELTSN